MALQFITGPSGAGKSHYLYRYLISESEKNTEKTYILLVPDQYNMQAQKDYIHMNPKHGMLNVEILSFGRLAYRLMEEQGFSNRIVLDEVGKSFVLRKVVENCIPKLQVLKNQLRKLGYIDELKSILSEFAQYGIYPDNISEIMGKLEPGCTLWLKLQDIQLIYKEFYEYLSGRYITSEERMELLRELIPTSKLLAGSEIILDGFTGFTPIQKKLIEEMLLACNQVKVSVIFRENDPFKLYTLGRETIDSLTYIARKNGVFLEEPLTMEEKVPYRFRENEEIGLISNSLFRNRDAKYDRLPQKITLFAGDNLNQEVEQVAARIRRLVRTEGYRFRDIGVITTSPEEYQEIVRRVFDDYDIPVFLDAKRSVLLNSFVEYIRSLLDMGENDFSYESVFRCLRTGMTVLGRQEVDRLENYVRATGVRGYSRWSQEWVFTTGLIDEAELEELNEMRVRFMDSIEELMAVMKRRKKTVEEITTALFRFMTEQNLQQKVKEYETHFTEKNELVLAKEYAQIYRIVVDLFDQLVSLIGEVSVSLKEYGELLDAGLSQAKVGTIPPTIDKVVVGDVDRSRLPEVKVVFLVGLNDVYVPGKLKGEGFLSDYDREKLAALDVELAPTGKERIQIQKFYIHLVMTKPSERLFLSYARVSADGKGMRPSYIVGDMKRLFPLLEEEDKSACPEWTVNNGISHLIDGLQKKQVNAEWKELYAWYARKPEWRQKVQDIVSASVYRKPDDRLTEAVAKELYGAILRNSVSRLEKFMTCAYAHFVRYGLELKEREEASFRAMDFGNVFHKALELYARKLKEGGYTWSDVPESVRREIVERSVDESTLEYRGSSLYDTARENYAINRIRRLMYRTVWGLTYQLEQGDFEPAGYEVAFKRSYPLFDDCSMQLQGVIDRMDICEDGDRVYVKIIDYKTGSKEFDISSVYHGIQMQLITYLTVAMEMNRNLWPDKEIVPSGVMYYQIGDPLVEGGGDEQELQASILKSLKPSGLLNGDRTNIYHLDRNIQGSSLVIPVGVTKDGGLTKRSKVITNPQWKQLMKYAVDNVKEIGTRIMKGDIQISPYIKKDRTGCEYCEYRTICKFDEKIAGYGYRRLTEMDIESVMEIIGEEEMM